MILMQIIGDNTIIIVVQRVEYCLTRTASDMRPAFANVIGGESIITEQLILNLRWANYTSGSTWNDSSGEGHNGTINGATYNSGNGGYFDFDGTNDYININDTGVLPSGTN